MNYGTKQLQQHNQRTAKTGDIIALGPVCSSSLQTFVGVKADQAKLTRKQSDGSWFADISGSEWCIGSGFDWMIS